MDRTAFTTPTRISRFAAVLISCAFAASGSFAQLSPRINSAPDTPLSGALFSDYSSYALTSSLMTGSTVVLPWNESDSGTNNCPTPSFSTFDSTLANLIADGQPNGKFVNFIVAPVTEPTTNSYTPTYVFTQQWANNLASQGTCSGITSPSWAPATSFLPGDYILVNGVYWQETNQPWNSSFPFVGTCTTGGSEPLFHSNVGSYMDNSCTWTNMGSSNSPPQDACFSSYYPGDGVILQKSGLSIGCFNINTLPSGATITNLATGFPVSYEIPMKLAYKNFIQQVISHYQNSPPSGLKLGYVRFGLSTGGESEPFTSQAPWPYFNNLPGEGPPSGASIVYLSYTSDMMKFQNLNNQKSGNNPPITLIADMNLWNSVTDYPDQEARYATQNNIGIGTNGLQASDVAAINSAGNCNSSNPSISGDWCHNFQQYCSTKLPNGSYPICNLQTFLLSTPGNNAANHGLTTGALSNEYWDSSSGWTDFAGLVSTAKQYGANNLEIYTCDVLYTVMYSFTQNNYINSFCDLHANGHNSAYENDYYNAFSQFIQTASNPPGIYSPIAGANTQSDSSVTLTWNLNPGATSYTVWVGSSEGASDYYRSTSATSPLRVSLPALTSGTAVWVRWKPNNGSLVDYHYVAP